MKALPGIVLTVLCTFGVGCVEVLDKTPHSLPRTGGTLEVIIDRSSATVTNVEAKISGLSSISMSPAPGNRYTATVVPDPCRDLLSLYYRITYFDQDSNSTKVKLEPPDGFYYKQLTGSKPSYCGQGRRFVVNKTADVDDQTPGDGLCYAGYPAYGCTLRAAVQEANTDSIADLIVLPAGTFVLTQAGSDDTAAAGDLDLLFDVAIVGAGHGLTTIRSDAEAIFDVGIGTRNYVDVTLQGMTLDADENGRVIDNAGALRVVDSVLDSGWKTNAGGGCIHSTGVLDLERVEVRNCYAGLGPGGGLLVSAGSARVRKSAFHDNQTVQHGAGIAVIGTGTMNLEDSTLYANRASVYGGGLFVNGDLDVKVRNVTITDNDAYVTGSRGEGGGIFRGYGNGQLAVANSIVAGNRRNNFAYDDTSDCDGTITSLGGNIFGIESADCVIDDTYANGTDQKGENFRPVEPYLGSVQGWPPARTPMSISPALGAGNPGAPSQAYLLSCTREDQFGTDRTTAGACDIGAVQAP